MPISVSPILSDVTVARVLDQGAVGPCGARNRSLLAASTPWVFLIDADATPASDCLERLLDEARAHPEAAIVAPRVMRRGSTATIHYDGGQCHFLAEACFQNFNCPIGEAAEPQPWPTLAATTALLVRRSAALEWRLFDEDMVFFREDLDFCLRARMLGARIRHCPEAVVWHEQSERGVLHGRRVFFQTRNRWWAILKAYEWRTILLTLPLQAVYEVLNLCRAIAEGRTADYVSALADLMRRLPRLLRARRLLQARRCVPDRDLLSAPPLSWRPETLSLPGALVLHDFLGRLCATWWGLVLMGR